MPGVNAEQVLDKIAELLIQQFENLGLSDLTEAQKIADPTTGQISYGREDGQKLILFQRDTEADSQDLTVAENIAMVIENPVALSSAKLTIYDYQETKRILFSIESMVGIPPFSNAEAGPPTGWPEGGDAIPTGWVDISSIVNTDNPINIGQFVGFDETQTEILPDRAKDILDTSIYELVSRVPGRQERINKFFQDWNALKGNKPGFDLDLDGDNINDTWEKDLEDNQDSHSNTNDISAGGSNITRLDRHGYGVNAGKTLESLYRELKDYLSDILKTPKIPPMDERPDYVPQSDGYIQLRNLNQGIIIRKQEGTDIGVEDEYLVTNPANPLYTDDGAETPSPTRYAPSYLANGFTVSMWVRFLDKVSTGTLFNYGNPFRTKDPKGFKLETFIIQGDSFTDARQSQTWSEIAPNGFFQNGNTKRFVRLVVKDHIMDRLYDSHLCIDNAMSWSGDDSIETASGAVKFVPEFGNSALSEFNYLEGDEKYLLSHTEIPVNFDEWYFIVATFNPTINDSIDTAGITAATSFGLGETSAAGGIDWGYLRTKDYWKGHIDPDNGTGDGGVSPLYQAKSGYGSKCKVEIISKSDLLRARGYKS